MTPGARIQAATQLLDEILVSWQQDKRFPADKQIDRYFKSRRYIGSKDRAAIGELVYWVLRHKGSLEWWTDHIIARSGCDEAIQRFVTPAKAGGLRNDNKSRCARNDGRFYILTALLLRGEYDASSLQTLSEGKYGISPLTAEEKSYAGSLAGKSLEHPDMPAHIRLNHPEWMEPLLRASLGADYEAALRALNEQAPTDLRVNTLKTTREALLKQLKEEGFEASPAPLSSTGIRLAKRAPVFTSAAFKQGHFEVQDEGSQLVAQLVDAQPGQRVIDFCAGAGGKTLAMAAAMQNKGRILAWDVSEKRLGQIKERLRRAGVDNVQTHVIENEHDQFIKRHKASADRVLVDAPCSGSGTWRRNPDLKWRFTPKDLEEVTAIQQSILQSAARLVKPGGRLIYATCSILREENETQVEELLKHVNDFRVVCAEKIWDKNAPDGESSAGSFLRVTPHHDGVDGFFAAVLERGREASLRNDNA